MKSINPVSLPAPSGYNNGMISECGKILFVAGQIGWNKNGRMADSLVTQFDRAIYNILEVVRAAGGEIENIVRFTVYIKDKRDYVTHRKEIGEVYRTHMGKHFPAMSLIVVRDLLEKGALVEIEATAVLP